MVETRDIEMIPSMVFDVSLGGNMALAYLGSSEDLQSNAVALTGYFPVAPNQRGYGAASSRPTGHASYRIDHLVQDALEIATSLVTESGAFIFGHGWGGCRLANRRSATRPTGIPLDCIASASLAFARALEMPDGEE